MSKDSRRLWLNLAATIIAITINILANALPINGQNTGEISDRFKVFFVPAGYVFAIWGVIYIGWIAFSIYQLLPAQRNNPRLAKIGDWYILGAVANSVWIFLWHYNYFTLTVLAMLTLLTSLLIIYQRLNIGLTRPSTIERWCVDIPFSVYLGWISVATIANVTDALYDLGWNGGPIAPDAWAVVMLIVALGLSLVLLQTRRDIAYSAVIVWAAVGIAAKQADTALVANAAWAVAVVVALTMAAPYLRRGRMAST